MSNPDYQAQITALYNSLAAINASLSKLAPYVSVSSTQADMQQQMNGITARLDDLMNAVNVMQLAMNDLLIELRSK